jgi:HTH-type transcriptional regulator/antitoxin HigA
MMTRPLDFARPHLLRSDHEYQHAVARLRDLLDDGARKHREESEFLALLIEQYDREHFAVEEELTPQEVVDFLLEQHGMTRADLAAPFGGRSRVSDFFAGKRDLSKTQMAWLHRELGAPLDLLMGDLARA